MTITDHEAQVRAEVRMLKRTITPAEAYRAIALRRVHAQADSDIGQRAIALSNYEHDIQKGTRRAMNDPIDYASTAAKLRAAIENGDCCAWDIDTFHALQAAVRLCVREELVAFLIAMIEADGAVRAGASIYELARHIRLFDGPVQP